MQAVERGPSRPPGPDLPLILQVSRFDRFKDPRGVIEAFLLVRTMVPVRLVLVGSSAADDPEGAEVLAQVLRAADGHSDVHVLPLPPDSHRTVNALQRGADVVVQKSPREGFGLTVTEGMWESKPVIGGDTGGIRLQVTDHYTGYLVRTPEGASPRLRCLLYRQDVRQAMSVRAHRFVGRHFLLARQLREYLALMVGRLHGGDDRIEVGVGFARLAGVRR